MVISNDHRTSAGTDERAILFGNAASLIGAVIFVLSAATMVFLYIRMLFMAMRWVGLLLGLISAPAAVAYPFLQWISSSAFPTGVFIIWLAGVLGMAMTMTWAAWGRYRALSARRHARTTAVLAAEELE